MAARVNMLEVSKTVSNCSLVVCLFSEIKFPELDEYLQKFQVCISHRIRVYTNNILIFYLLVP